MKTINNCPQSIDYCFNEFLKMAEFLQGEMDVDRKTFLKFLLIVFEDKVFKSTQDELLPLDPFPLP